MKAKNVVNKSKGSINSRRNTFKRNKLAHFSEAIHNNKNASIAIRGREVSNKIHRDRGPRAFSDFQRLKKAIWFVTEGFSATANIARPNIILDIFEKRRPPKISRNEITGFLEAEMTSGRRIMAEFKDGRSTF